MTVHSFDSRGRFHYKHEIYMSVRDGEISLGRKAQLSFKEYSKFRENHTIGWAFPSLKVLMVEGDLSPYTLDIEMFSNEKLKVRSQFFTPDAWDKYVIEEEDIDLQFPSSDQVSKSRKHSKDLLEEKL